MKLEELDETSKQIWMETIIKRVINQLKNEIFSKSVKFIGFRQAILKDFEAFIIDNTNKEINGLIPDKDIMRQAVRAVTSQQL
jgi:hypothetical protein